LLIKRPVKRFFKQSDFVDKIFIYIWPTLFLEAFSDFLKGIECSNHKKNIIKKLEDLISKYLKCG